MSNKTKRKTSDKDYWRFPKTFRYSIKDKRHRILLAIKALHHEKEFERL